MKNFKVPLFFLLVLVQLIGTISGQTCRSNRPQERIWIPTTWRTIVDTADYNDLLGSGASSWMSRNLDGVGSSFDQVGGLCTRSLRSCAIIDTGTENNWVFSPYINYEAAREVFYNVSSTYLTLCGSCPRHLTAYRYDTNTASETARTNFASYSLLTGSESSSRYSASSMLIETVRPSGINGFYFSLRDTGACATVVRIIIYYRVCAPMVNGLVIFPEVAVPPRSSPNEAYNATCAPNSHPVTSLAVDITSSTSVCTVRDPRGAQCECDAGYMRFNDTVCEGKYLCIIKL